MDKLIVVIAVVLLLMMQIGIFSNLTLLHGTPDVMLVALIAWALNDRVKTGWLWGILSGILIGFVSALPFVLVLIGYVSITGFAIFFRQRVWQAPLLAVFMMTLFGSLIMMGLALVNLGFSGGGFSLEAAFSQIVLPTVLMNLMIALPIHYIFLDFADWLYPLEEEV